jgi:DNA-binding response OmpR family regulator
MAQVLIVEDSPTQSQHIQLMLEDEAHTVETAPDGAAALRAMAVRRPDLVVTDLEMPEMNGLQLVEAVRRDYPGIPIVLMTAHGSEEIAAVALRAGAASYVPKALLAEHLVDTVNSVLSVSAPAAAERLAVECLSRSDETLTLPNDPALIPAVIGHLDYLLTNLQFADATERMRVSVALREALLNAMDHGNLEVGSELRQDDERAYHDLAARRRQETPYKDRRVHLQTRLSGDEVIFVVRDEGPGFDPTRLADPTDPANWERVGGRGLLLIRTFMDKVWHNDSGNELTMIKHAEK